MNKIVVDSIRNICLDSDTSLFLHLSDETGSIEVRVLDNISVNINIIALGCSVDYRFVLGKNVSMNIDSLYVNGHNKEEFDYFGDNTVVNCKTGIISSSDNIFVQRFNHNALNTKSDILNDVINFGGNFDLDVDVLVDKNITNCYTRQNNKIINIAGCNNRILPNLLISNNVVDAYHSAYIGDFDSEKLFYLNSRGLTKKCAYQLVMMGSLMPKYSNDNSEEFLKVIEKYLEEVNYESR